MHNGVGKIAINLNCMYDDKIGYKREKVNRKISSSERNTIPAVL